eukprot:15347124-Heterocapsa_arctica.AAC.2
MSEPDTASWKMVSTTCSVPSDSGTPGQACRLFLGYSTRFSGPSPISETRMSPSTSATAEEQASASSGRGTTCAPQACGAPEGTVVPDKGALAPVAPNAPAIALLISDP